jgi:hypothetical protein
MEGSPNLFKPIVTPLAIPRIRGVPYVSPEANMEGSIIAAAVTAVVGLAVWFFKLILIERYQFMDKIADKPIGIPYVLIRLDRLTGAVHAFNWAGWVKIKPHSGYPGTETPE